MMTSMIGSPESVDKTLAATIYKLDSVTKCLEESLNEWTEEQHQKHRQRQNETNDNDDENEEDNDDDDDDSVIIRIHKSFQNKLLNKYGESMVQAYHQHHKEREGNGENKILEDTHRKNKKSNKSTTTDQNETEAPAALLTGTLKHYNRYEGNWRIVISDASIRPRINIPYNDTTDVDARKRTLFDHSAMEIERQLKRAKSNEQQTTNLQELPSMNEDGSIKLNGDVVILAYDDYVISNPKSE